MEANFITCVCVLSVVYHIYVQGYVSPCTYTETREDIGGPLSHSLLYCSQGLSHWLQASSNDSPVSASNNTEVTARCGAAQLFTWVMESELRSSCLNSKYSYPMNCLCST